MYEKILYTENMEQTANLFGNFDVNAAKLEKAFGIAVTNRESDRSGGDAIILRSEDSDALLSAFSALEYLYSMVKMGTELSEQSVDYVINTVKSGEPLERFGDDCICVTTRGKPIKARTVGQKKYIDAIKKNTVVFGVGPAGTGKTYLAVALAVSAFKNKEVEKIILTRPAVEAGEKLGFLPGDLQNKVDPYLRPLYDALQEMLGMDGYLKLIERGVIEIAPLAYMRGRTLSNAFIILDEAQNTTKEQMKMFLTRMGEGSRMVITGDLTQIDLPEGKKSGLKHATRILGNINGIGVIYLTASDVVRHSLVMEIIRAYERAETTENKELNEKNKRKT